MAGLNEYVQGLNETLQTLFAEAAEEIQLAVQEQARSIPVWRGAADDIELWAEDDEVVIGVRGGSVEQAALAEFGSESQAPVPVLRASDPIVRESILKVNDQIRRLVGLV